jgi:hypothetical protein
MKTGKLILIAGILSFAGACVPSVIPFYTQKDILFDTRLVGEWQTKDNPPDQTWNFQRSGDNAYKLSISEKDGKHGELDARLFKIKDQMFLDLIPDHCDFAADQADIVSAAVFPGHLVMRVSQLEPALQLAGCDYDWLAKHLEAHPESLLHHSEEKRVVLTAPTKDLQAFVLQHLEEMFPKPEELARKPAKDASKSR